MPITQLRNTHHSDTDVDVGNANDDANESQRTEEPTVELSAGSVGSVGLAESVTVGLKMKLKM